MGELRSDRQVRVAAVLAVAVAVIGFLLISGGDDDQGAEGPTIVTTDELEEIAEDAERPIYSGRRAARHPARCTSGTEDGLVYVRYVAADAEAYDPSKSFLTVGTYTVDDAVKDLEEVAEEEDTIRNDLPDGGLVVINTERPSSAYAGVSRCRGAGRGLRS